MSKFRKCIVAAAGAVVALGSAVSPASAEATLEIDYVGDRQGQLYCKPFAYTDTISGVNTHAGKGSFCPKGDYLWVFDDLNDDQRVALHWRLGDGSRRGLCIITDGYGSDGMCNKEFIEGKYVEWRVGRCDGDVSPCNEIAHYNNWGTTRITSTGDGDGV